MDRMRELTISLTQDRCVELLLFSTAAGVTPEDVVSALVVYFLNSYFRKENMKNEN